MIRKTRIFIICGLSVAVIIAVTACWLFFFHPKPVWIVDDRYIEVWEKVLNGSPLQGAAIISRSSVEAPFPRSWYGYRISSSPEDSPENSDEEDDSLVRVYRGLSRQRKLDKAMPLALDPWLVFRMYTTPSLSRMAAEKGPDENGQIFLAGSDTSAVQAWAAQFLQDSPGIFEKNEEIWSRSGERLLQSRNFQAGAMTYGWNEIWPFLFEENINVWVYAPLSRIRGLPVVQTNNLEADVFPSISGWTEFGIQADIVWAIPYGNEENREKLDAAEIWLGSVAFQTLLSDALGWLAVHPEAPPYNPVSGNARIAWLTSSYVWNMSN